MRRSLRPALLAAPLALLLLACGQGAVSDLVSSFRPGALSPGIDWPPVVGEAYPDLALRGLDGETVRLSDFRGRVLLIEPVGMT